MWSPPATRWLHDCGSGLSSLKAAPYLVGQDGLCGSTTTVEAAGRPCLTPAEPHMCRKYSSEAAGWTAEPLRAFHRRHALLSQLWADDSEPGAGQRSLDSYGPPTLQSCIIRSRLILSGLRDVAQGRHSRGTCLSNAQHQTCTRAERDTCSLHQPHGRRRPRGRFPMVPKGRGPQREV